MFIFAGSYASSKDQGIHMIHLNLDQGKMTYTGGISGIENPAFLVVDALRARLYAVSETAQGAVVAYRYDATAGVLTEINRQPTRGGSPCHLALDASGRWLFTVNYAGGSVCVYPVDAQGFIQPMSDFIQHKGHSLRADRQEAAHPHSIFAVPGVSDHWLVPDLGTDRIALYQHLPATGKLALRAEISVEPGSGPRHLAFHPHLPLLYVIMELSSTIAVYAYDVKGETFAKRQETSALPADYLGESFGADIHVHPSGTFLYGSNRGHDSLVVYPILANGGIAAGKHFSCQGRIPRNFALSSDGSHVLIANQASDEIVMMRLDQGLPSRVRFAYPMNKPVCIKFV